MILVVYYIRTVKKVNRSNKLKAYDKLQNLENPYYIVVSPYHLFTICDGRTCSYIFHTLVVPRLFEEKWRDTVFGFPWGVARGAWFRVFSGYFVPLTPPTVSVRSF